jgi:lysophospholipase L1-like esterase
MPFFPGLFLVLASVSLIHADPIVVWPKPPLPSGQNVHTFPVAPVAWLDNFKDRMDQKSKAGPVDLLFDGDSITDHWPYVAPKVWQAHFGDRRAFDVGIGADGVEHAIWRLDHGEVDGLHPKLIVLLIGTNNIQAHTPEEVSGGIAALLADYRQRLPDAHILLLGIFPRAQLASDPIRAKIAQANQIISKLADGKNITYIDIGAKFLEPDGSLTLGMMDDYLHPTPKGYEIWASAIQSVVDQYCPASSATPAPASPPVPEPLQPFTVSWPLPQPPSGTNPLTFPVANLDWYIHWFARYQKNVDRAKSNAYDLIFDGDVNMEHLQYEGEDAWKKHYASLKAADFAIEDEPENNLWRLLHGQIDGQNPKLVVLQFTYGWNDNQEPAQLAEGIKLVLHEYQTRCPAAHIQLISSMPRGAEANSPHRAWPASLNKILASLADGQRVTYLDITSKFLQPNGTQIPGDFQPDTLRLTAQGYATFTDAIQPVIDQYVNGKNHP